MFFRRATKPVPSAVDAGRDALHDLVHEHSSELDEDAQRLIVSVAGLLACVAYADREYKAAEQDYTRQALLRMQGLTEVGVEAICSVLARRGTQIAAINPQAYTRELRERTDVELRREVLDVLLDLAAADGELSLAETDLLRRTTSALGLTPDDYVASQARHRDKIKLLRR
jgi:uncharacterized tellurite resistance protein B-like protein